ncbi:MAG: glycosyltransferase family 4 protein [Candidatus Brocadiaceae bacterium]|nr:glycosyltransferase family 4 protein [Candidatus Brocadiaceae bacterium]
MRIGIDARILSEENTGIYNYVFHLLCNLQEIDDTNDYFLFSHAEFEMPLKNNRWHKIVGNGITAGVSKLWFQTGLIPLIKKTKIDIFWATCNLLPLALPSRVRTLLTVHDLTYLFYPETMAMKNLLAYRLLQRRSIKTADRIIADSEATARDVKSYFGITPNKMEVLPCGINRSMFLPVCGEELDRKVKKYGIRHKYLLTVSTLEPRKNLVNVLRSYEALIRNSTIDHDLVIVGARGWKTSFLYKEVRLLGLEERVRFLGYVPEDDLPALYSGADALLFLSLYEGFGLPILEAMACGCPVITSHVSSMPEVAGRAAILVNPENIGEISQAVHGLLRDKERCAALRSAGQERIRQFEWRDRSRRLSEIFQQLSS